jgi:hypothetical protein
MEILIAVLAIIFFIAKNVANNKAQETAQPNMNRTQPADNSVETEKTAEVFRPGAEGYRNPSRIGEKLEKKPMARNRYVSTEGSASTEGECIEPNPNHCVTDHIDDAIYSAEINDEGISLDLDRESIVKGIIMAEIISKPKWKQ